MHPPSADDLAEYMGPAYAADAVMVECVDVAAGYVEQRIGDLAGLTRGEAVAREAILIIAKHMYGIRHNPTAHAGQFVSNDAAPAPAGYLVPHRAAALLDSLWAVNPGSIGIG